MLRSATMINVNVEQRSGQKFRVLLAVAEAGQDSQLQAPSLFESEPRGIKITKFFLRFFEHSEIDVAFSGL
jgi:hypothetical protein